MRATCMRGLEWLAARFAPEPHDGWLLLPADHPTCRPAIVRALLKAASEQPERSIFVPVHGGRRGHPVLLRWEHAAAIRTMPAERGLNHYIRERVAETLELAWPDADILCDLDTPEDYRRLLDSPLEG